MDGYIKLFRKIREWEWYQDINVKTVFLELLLTANIKDCKYKGFLVPRGCILTTFDALADTTSLTKNEVRRVMNKLKTSQEVNTQKALNKLLINVLNFDVYQEQSKTDKAAAHTRRTHEKHTVNTPIEREEEEYIYCPGKPPDVSKKPKKMKREYSADSKEMMLASLLGDLMQENNPNVKLPDDLNGWADSVRLMIARDKRDPQDIADIIQFSQWHSFWKGNILSMPKLREKYDQLWLQREGMKKHA